MQLGNIEIITLLINFTFGTIYFTSLSLHFLICNVRGFVRGLRTMYIKELEHIIIITHQAAVAIISTLLAMWDSRTTLASRPCMFSGHFGTVFVVVVVVFTDSKFIPLELCSLL